MLAPFCRYFRQHIDSGPDILAPFRVMGGRGGEAGWPLGSPILHVLVKCGKRYPKVLGFSTHFIQGCQAVVTIKGSILNAFCGHRAGGLLKFHDKRANDFPIKIRGILGDSQEEIADKIEYQVADGGIAAFCPCHRR